MTLALPMATFANGPLGVWMLTDGSNQTDVLIHGNSVTTYAQANGTNLQYAVQWDPTYGWFETVGRDPGGIGGVYDINHNQVGTFSNNSTLKGYYLDGTLDTSINRTFAAVVGSYGQNNGIVEYGDGIFNGPASLIWSPTNGDYANSVTYAQSTDLLYVGGTNEIQIITAGGAYVGAFNTVGGYVRSLAYDASDNTLWYLGDNGANAYQYSLSGGLLQVDNVNLGGNYWGGEIAPRAVPEPMSVLVLGGGLLALARRRRNSR